MIPFYSLDLVLKFKVNFNMSKLEKKSNSVFTKNAIGVILTIFTIIALGEIAYYLGRYTNNC